MFYEIAFRYGVEQRATPPRTRTNSNITRILRLAVFTQTLYTFKNDLILGDEIQNRLIFFF